MFLFAIMGYYFFGDPDTGDTVTYDVYFGSTSPPPQVAWGQTGESYDPGSMSYDTSYYWQIISWDNHGVSASGPIWSFVAEPPPNNPPYVPSNPDPSDGELDVDVNYDLSWTCSDPDGDDLTYDVYFDTVDPPVDQVSSNQTETIYDPGTMDYDTSYYWQIIAWDTHGAYNSSPVWSFVTSSPPNDPPYTPSNPDPQNGTINIDVEKN